MAAFVRSIREVYRKMASFLQPQEGFKPTAYLRSQGPVCYTARVLYNPQVRVELPEELMASDLDWCWESGRRDSDDSTYDNPDLPPERSMTRLTLGNKPQFLADMQERNSDGYGRRIHIFGTDPSSVSTLLNPIGFQAEFERFTTYEGGAIHMALIQVSDMNYEYIFVRHDPVEPVRKLLESWGVHPDIVRNPHPYSQLNAAKLESILTLHRENT